MPKHRTGLMAMQQRPSKPTLFGCCDGENEKAGSWLSSLHSALFPAEGPALR